MSTICREDHGNCGNSTVVSTTCTRKGKTRQNYDMHLWNLHDMYNQDVGHIVNELRLCNLNGHLNSEGPWGSASA